MCRQANGGTLNSFIPRGVLRGIEFDDFHQFLFVVDQYRVLDADKVFAFLKDTKFAESLRCFVVVLGVRNIPLVELLIPCNEQRIVDVASVDRVCGLGFLTLWNDTLVLVVEITSRDFIAEPAGDPRCT